MPHASEAVEEEDPSSENDVSAPFAAPTDFVFNPPENAEYLCPFCNSKYTSSTAFKQHMKFHESETVKEERNIMMNNVVSACFSEYKTV